MKGNLTTRPISVVCVNVVFHLSNSYTRLALPCCYNNCKQSTHPVPVTTHNNTRLRFSWTNSLPSLELISAFFHWDAGIVYFNWSGWSSVRILRTKLKCRRSQTYCPFGAFLKFAYKRLLGSKTRERLRVGKFFNREIKHRVYGKQQTWDSSWEIFQMRNEQIKTA